jgi:hypothetical protein
VHHDSSNPDYRGCHSNMKQSPSFGARSVK